MTIGALTITPQTFLVDDVLRGVGASTAKSVALLSVSVQPFIARITAVVFDGAAVGAVSENDAPPKPTKSTMRLSVGAATVSAVVVDSSATLPAVALSAMAPVASGVGRLTEPPAPTASCTR